MNNKLKFLTLLIPLSIIFVTCHRVGTEGIDTLKQHIEENIYLKNTDPINYLSFEDLDKLSRTAEPKGEIKDRLTNHLSMVYILNRPTEAKLTNSHIRIAQWNIKRGLNAYEIKELLINTKNYENKGIKNLKIWDRKRFKNELNTFANADILCLNEVDIGMPRTGYKNIVSYIADPLNLNYAYATEFIEVGPLFLMSNINKNLYKGLHGNVIISKYPIISAEVIRLPKIYSWYKGEINRYQSPLEHFRKGLAKGIFSQGIERYEVRHGERNAIIADIKLPNDKIITVISTHFEDRAYPDERLKQFKYLLEKIKDKKTPVILAGDLNTSTTDTKPTYFKKEVEKRIRDPHFILRAIGSAFVPGFPIVSGLAAVTASKLIQYKDPFFPNIPVIFPNHERKFYTYLKKFRFSDGIPFDLSGDKKRSSNGRKGLLANSNQRHWKGFKSTYKLEEPRIIAYFKLDWFFVKPIGKFCLPFNGKTLKTLNRSLKKGISDHNPITVDIMLY